MSVTIDRQGELDFTAPPPPAAQPEATAPAKKRETVNELEAEFDKFNVANPQVMAALVRLAREWRRKHAGPVGLAMLYELVRWEAMMATNSPDGFKLSNNHRAYYARRIMEDNVDLVGVFNLRTVAGE